MLDNKCACIDFDKCMSIRRDKMFRVVDGIDVCGKMDAESMMVYHKSEEMRYEKNRLQSFINWPLPFVSPDLLAMNGFYYIGPHDMVRCNFCGINLGHWECDDVISKEHEKYSYNCPMITLMWCDNISLSTTKSHKNEPGIIYNWENKDYVKCNICDLRIARLDINRIDGYHRYWSSFCPGTKRMENLKHINNIIGKMEGELDGVKSVLEKQAALTVSKNEHIARAARKSLNNFAIFYNKLMETYPVRYQ